MTTSPGVGQSPRDARDETVPAGTPHAESGIGPDRSSPVSASVLVLLVVAIALAVALLAIAAHQYREQVMAEAENRTAAIARVLEEHAAKTLGIHANTLAHIEWMVDDLGWDGIARSPLLYERLKSMAANAAEVQSYWITDETGTVRVSSFEWPIRPLNAADRDYFKSHLDGGASIHIGSRLSGKIIPEVFFTLSRRMETSDHRFQGVAQISLLPSYFTDFYRSVLHDPQDVVMLLREDGEVLVREPTSAAERTASPDRVDIGRYSDLIAIPQDGGVFRAVTAFDGVERLIARRKVPNLPVYVVYGTDVRAIDAAWRDRVEPYALFIAPAAVLLVLLGGVALRRSRQAAEAQEALRRANEALESRIAERTSHLNQALADKEVLLRDIHHRVKNNLQVILSLLELQAQRVPELEAPFSEALTRINTMGLIHEQIYRSTGVSSVSLDAFIGALAQHLQGFHRRPGRDIVIVHNVAPVSIDLNRVVPFALILNEVVSNAFKHAFQDRPTGTITVEVSGEGPSLRLVVQDDGLGGGDLSQARDENGRRSMGMDLIRAFARQIEGTYRFSHDNGTRFDLTFPKDGETF